MKYLHLDLETIPTQRPDLIERIKAEHTVSDAELADEKADGRLKKPADCKTSEDEEKAQKALDADIAKKKSALIMKALEAVDKAHRETALDGWTGHIASIAWALDDSPVASLAAVEIVGPIDASDGEWEAAIDVSCERDRIVQFLATVAQQVAATGARDTEVIVVVGHRVRAFDVLFLWQRCVALRRLRARPQVLRRREGCQRRLRTRRARPAPAGAGDPGERPTGRRGRPPPARLRPSARDLRDHRLAEEGGAGARLLARRRQALARQGQGLMAISKYRDRYTPAEIKVLRERYPTGGAYAVQAVLSHRTIPSIRVAAGRRRISVLPGAVPKGGRKQVWTAPEIAILRAHYGVEGPAECVRLLPRRTIDAVYMKAFALGLVEPQAPLWREEAVPCA